MVIPQEKTRISGGIRILGFFLKKLSHSPDAIIKVTQMDLFVAGCLTHISLGLCKNWFHE